MQYRAKRSYALSLLCPAIAFTAGLLAAFSPLPAYGYVCGDQNADASVDLADAVGIISYIFIGGPPAAPPEAADANCDGLVNIGDAVFLIRYIFADGPQPCSTCPEITQPILFEVSYSNYAWFPRMDGFYIDSAGRVMTYSYPSDSIPYPPPYWWQELTEDELLERYSHNPGICATIPMVELQQKYALVAGAAQGELSPEVWMCADFGVIFFVAYIYQPETSVYHPVLIEMAGDMAQKNLSPQAEQLFEWLNMCGWYNIPCRYGDFK